MINKKDTLLFIGLGGAGQRHLRIFRKLLPENNFIALRKTKKTPHLNEDFSINNSIKLEDKYSLKIIESENDLENYSPTLTIVSTPSSLLTKYTKIAHSIGSNVLVEKPGLTSYNEYKKIEKIYKDSSLTYQIGFQRRFNDQYIKLKKIVKKEYYGKILLVTVEVSSFVPDWHPYEDYKRLYACRSDLGGGVLLTESHEIDLICDLLGEPTEIYSNHIKHSKYHLDIYDTVTLETNFKDVKVMFNLSFLRKPLKRVIKIQFEEGIAILDMNSNKLSISTERKKEEYEDVKKFKSNDELYIKQAESIIKLKNENIKVLSNIKNTVKILDKDCHNKKKYTIK